MTLLKSIKNTQTCLDSINAADMSTTKLPTTQALNFVQNYMYLKTLIFDNHFGIAYLTKKKTNHGDMNRLELHSTQIICVYAVLNKYIKKFTFCVKIK